jgi:hypothetical protein
MYLLVDAAPPKEKPPDGAAAVLPNMLAVLAMILVKRQESQQIHTNHQVEDGVEA